MLLEDPAEMMYGIEPDVCRYLGYRDTFGQEQSGVP